MYTEHVTIKVQHKSMNKVCFLEGILENSKPRANKGKTGKLFFFVIFDLGMVGREKHSWKMAENTTNNK